MTKGLKFLVGTQKSVGVPNHDFVVNKRRCDPTLLLEMGTERGDDLLFYPFYGTRKDHCGLITWAGSARLDFIISDKHTSCFDLFLEALKRRRSNVVWDTLASTSLFGIQTKQQCLGTFFDDRNRYSKLFSYRRFLAVGISRHFPRLV